MKNRIRFISDMFAMRVKRQAASGKKSFSSYEEKLFFGKGEEVKGVVGGRNTCRQPYVRRRRELQRDKGAPYMNRCSDMAGKVADFYADNTRIL